MNNLALRVIPCLDVADGRVVKGVNFVDLRDAGDPVDQARLYAEMGADEICFLDISATLEGRNTMLDLVSAVAKDVFIPLSVGGGVRSLDDIHKLLRAGADKISINSAALQNPKLVQEASRAFGAQCVIVAIDARRGAHDNLWQVYSHGGTKNTGKDAVAWAKMMAEYGAGEILLTSMDRDGTKAGYDLALLRAVRDAVNVPIIASGGVGCVDDMVAGVQKGGASAVLAASIFHFGTHSIKDVHDGLGKAGIVVRQ
ncbi:MAG: imidazole glycerol phosphate synthase subunit HisF [Pseudomonadota bacterium]